MFSSIVTATVVLLGSALGLLVYRVRREGLLNRMFLYFCLLTSVWVVAEHVSTLLYPSLFFSRLSLFLAVPHSLLFFFLAKLMVDKRHRFGRKYLLVLFFSTLIVMLVTIMPLTLSMGLMDGKQELLRGWGMLPFAFFVGCASIGAVYVLVKSVFWGQREGRERKSLIMMLLGVFFMLTLIIGTIVIPVAISNNLFFVQFSPHYTLVFLVFTSIAILKYQLFDIKVFATRLFIILIWLLLFITTFVSGGTDAFNMNLLSFGGALILGFLLWRSLNKEVATHVSAERRKAAEALEHQRDAFLLDNSRQIKSVLRGFQEFTDLLKKGAYGKPTQKLQKAVGSIESSNNRVVTLVDTYMALLDSSQEITCNAERVQLNELIQEVVTEFSHAAETKGLYISWRSVDLADIHCDREKIRQVLRILLDNAIKYTSSGMIRITASEKKTRTTISVLDEGVGFTPDQQKRLFSSERQQQAHAGHAKHAGLGLYIAKRFVEIHDGGISAHSPGPGKGSEFVFWIPKRS